MTKFEELIAKLSELFELDKADLDFGIHRIIKSKHKQIEQYLHDSLPETVRGVLGELAQAESAGNIAEIKQSIRDNLAADAIDDEGNLDDQYKATKLGKQYLTALESASDAKAAERMETEVYSHLYNFFSRYYEDADFISLRRRTAGKESYSIPYDGQEVVLHWANKDQYYIKSSEDLKDYTFTTHVGQTPFRIKFKLTRMDAIQNNNKASRIFQIDEETEIESTDDTLVIPFHFAEGKKRTNPQAAAWEKTVIEAIPQVWQSRLNAKDESYTGDGNRTILQKHLRNYTKKNTADYFIHKDLGGFLRRELDFFIKNEVMYLDDIDNRPADYLERELRKIKAVRAVAHDLIVFLAQFENFQKKIWLKKKFVIESNWCVTLDRVPESMYEEIAANDGQRAEWVSLFAIDEITDDEFGKVAYSEPLSVDFLKTNDKLILDTAFYPTDFKYRLLAEMEGHDDIDTHTNGLLVHSDNFQALNFLQEKYRKRVECIYIDPPYNSPSSEIIYKNNYKHSSFLSLINDRMLIAKTFSTKTGSAITAIDENEGNALLRMAMEIYPEHDVVNVAVEHNRKGIQGDHFSYTNEFAIFAIPMELKKLNRMPLPKDEWEYSNFRNWGGESLREDAANCFYPVFVKGNDIVGFGDVCEDDFHPQAANIEQEDGSIAVYPIDANEIERKWRYADSTVQGIFEQLKVERSKNGTLQIKIAKIDSQFKTVWCSPRYNAGDHGTGVLTSMGFSKADFDFPKSVNTVQDSIFAVSGRESIVLDYFAGSGTTAQAVMRLNREDEGSRKYILAEMGNYFTITTKRRVMKSAYSDKWNEGSPSDRNTGISHLFNYMRLESYEDALNNLELEDRTNDILGLPCEVSDDYLLRYALEFETRKSLLDLKKYEDPLNCTLKIYNRETGEAEPTPIDLPETFNYLLGLRVRTTQMRDGFLVIEGENPAAETVLVIWRNTKENDNKALEKFVTKTLRINTSDTEYAAIYINGDTTLEDPHKKILLTEQAFHELMFNVEGL